MTPRMRPTRCPSLAALALLALGVHAPAAHSQEPPAASRACPAPAEVDHRHLHGQWRAQSDGPTGATGLVQLGPHPELAQSVRGTVQRAGTLAQASGDVDAGTFTLEESLNGTNISATWIGQVVEGKCGKEIRGTWTNASPPTSLPFVLRRQAGW